MSVATKNPFALLDDDAPAVTAPVQKEEPAPAPAPAARGTAQKSRGGPAARGGKYYARGGKPKDAAPAATEDSEAPKKFEAREPRDGARGRGRGRGAPRGGRGRPFDRHSQTGKTDSDKKIHQSWGGDDGNTELKVEEAAVVDATTEATGAEWGAEASAADWSGATGEASADAWAAPATESADAEAKPERRSRRDAEPEEEDNTLTLDQYLAQQKEKDAIVPKLETRKANDGANDVFKDAIALTKNEEEDAYFVGKSKSAPKTRAKKEEKVYLEIDARFERPDRGGRGRGRGGEGRGGDRGARGTRGRGAPRGGRQNGASAPVVNVDDQTAFPSLS
ncbi:hypothetical protein BDN70DRAFT_876355 [Pholiota conissans]|uniref:Hyaluronan/mRNA-binding protein domain-containing protein n=1 Tax=Pholiota conissans TaxID=109636 RepID=A0A9P6D2F9_9AGAR|nr:hypothetical protein BDN70DRAFT_876355 [Pholiota conissans]